MSRITLIFLTVGLLGLLTAMTVSLSPLPTALIAAGYIMMFLGAVGVVISAALARSIVRPTVR
ncbi:MAG: hypothetical protein AB3N22_11020 [Ruegeria sp.]